MAAMPEKRKRAQETGSSKLDELLLALCACDLIVSRDRRRPTEEDTVRSRRCLGRLTLFPYVKLKRKAVHGRLQA
ncbi:hypothetical protein OPV22_006426 [Ensete ventricosum]|uniref:Uncharacterized protein n=1 Tax=Ensete ventricosum TaxID=4639 RepID=A0AAV8RF11_ENSVE|nr:hypothetical protein OPV22_006426 [Ensete ventricosum]